MSDLIAILGRLTLIVCVALGAAGCLILAIGHFVNWWHNQLNFSRWARFVRERRRRCWAKLP